MATGTPLLLASVAAVLLGGGRIALGAAFVVLVRLLPGTSKH